MVGDEEEKRLGIGRAEVGIDGGKLLLLAAASVEGLKAANKEDLEGSHERRGLGAVEEFEDRGVGEVGVGKAEVAEIGRYQRGEDALAATLVEEDLVASEDVARAEVRSGNFGQEAV